MKAHWKEHDFITVSTGSVDDAVKTSGLQPNHSYSVLNVFEIDAGDKKELFLKLRNPYGKTNFKGKYSTGSNEFNLIASSILTWF